MNIPSDGQRVGEKMRDEAEEYGRTEKYCDREYGKVNR
jgi:hypothetical protein